MVGFGIGRKRVPEFDSRGKEGFWKRERFGRHVVKHKGANRIGMRGL